MEEEEDITIIIISLARNCNSAAPSSRSSPPCFIGPGCAAPSVQDTRTRDGNRQALTPTHPRSGTGRSRSAVALVLC